MYSQKTRAGDRLREKSGVSLALTLRLFERVPILRKLCLEKTLQIKVNHQKII